MLDGVVLAVGFVGGGEEGVVVVVAASSKSSSPPPVPDCWKEKCVRLILPLLVVVEDADTDTDEAGGVEGTTGVSIVVWVRSAAAVVVFLPPPPSKRQSVRKGEVI